jgi:hypothetical protein
MLNLAGGNRFRDGFARDVDLYSVSESFVSVHQYPPTTPFRIVIEFRIEADEDSVCHPVSLFNLG